jgi:hypothetical protein
MIRFYGGGGQLETRTTGQLQGLGSQFSAAAQVVDIARYCRSK